MELNLAFLALAFCSTLAPITAAAKAPTSLEEALECVFFVTTFGADGKPLKSGSAFVLEEKGVQWIHTNAHVIDGAARIEFKDLKGNVVTGFGRFACYSVGSGEVEMAAGQGKGNAPAIRYGGDGVRLELKRSREIAFSLHGAPDGIEKGHAVITLGDNDGDKTLETLEGEVVSSTGKVVLTTCKTKHGSSGGTLIDAKSFEVIGLNTWGVPADTKPLDSLWLDDPGVLAADCAGASLLHQASWTELPAREFLKGAGQVKSYLDTVRMLSLIYHTTPTKSGVTLKLDEPFAGPVTYRLAFDRYKRHPILRPVVELNEKLGRSQGSNIGVNNMEVVKTYGKAIVAIREAYEKESAAILKKTPPFYRIELEDSGLLEFGGACHANLLNAEKWFTKRASVGGTMPVGAWFELPPLSEFVSQDR
jgi:hypothetical protein